MRIDVLKNKFILNQLFIFLGIFAFNLILKSIKLDIYPLWYDEMISVKATFFDFGHIKHQSEWDTNPPFYYYCLWVWVKFFGISEYSVRFMSVLFSSLSSVFFYLICKKLTKNHIALLATFVYSIHQFIFIYSHEARSYSLLLFLITISTLLFYKFLEKPNYILGFGLGFVNFLIIYTHYLAGIFLFFQLIVLVVYHKQHYKEVGIALLTSIVLVFLRFTPKQFKLLFGFHSQTTEESWIKLANTDSLKQLIYNLFIDKYIAVLIIITIITGTFYLIKRTKQLNETTKPFFVFIYLTSIGSIMLFFLMGKFMHIFIDRYIIFSVPFIIILLQISLDSIHKHATLLLIPIICYQLITLNTETPKSMDFRTAAQVSSILQQKFNGFIIVQTNDVAELFTYYYKRESLENYKKLSENLLSSNVVIIRTFDDLKDINLNSAPVVLCQTFQKETDSNKIFEFLNSQDRLFSSTQAVKGVKITLFSREMR